MAGDVWSESTARRYDEDTAYLATPDILEATTAFLAETAAGGPVLDFAIGTGRVALPLAASGVPVSGIDQSAAMLAQLAGKAGGADIPVIVGDMTTTRLPGRFSLVYLVFNTIGNLLRQSEQVACFRNAAAHLVSGGAFVIELGVPALQRLAPGETELVFHHDDHHVGIDTYDVLDQRLVSHHYFVGEESRPPARSHHRYAWPAELDLMAALAGLHLTERWADWTRTPFTAQSTSHISVWRLPT